MAQNTYTINGGLAQPISGESADINMSTETGVMAGCREYPIPLLNRITVKSIGGGLSAYKSIYAGYKVVEQLLGAIVGSGSYNTTNPYLNTIISNARFGMFEPAHYSTTTNGRTNWNNHNMDAREIDSLINVGTGVKICVKIEYTKIGGGRAVEYAPIHGAEANFSKNENIDVPPYANIGGSVLPDTETVGSGYIQSPDRRAWFESVLSADSLNVDLNNYILEPDTSQNITITLMAYIGSPPTANNTFPILPMSSGSNTSITCPFQIYNPTINIANKDTYNNPDEYDDNYGSVAEYDPETFDDTIISINIVEP